MSLLVSNSSDSPIHSAHILLLEDPLRFQEHIVVPVNHWSKARRQSFRPPRSCLHFHFCFRGHISPGAFGQATVRAFGEGKIGVDIRCSSADENRASLPIWCYQVPHGLAPEFRVQDRRQGWTCVFFLRVRERKVTDSFLLPLLWCSFYCLWLMIQIR